MMSPREAVEQAIFVAVGAASLTRDRAQAIVDDLVRRGQMTDEEGRVTRHFGNRPGGARDHRNSGGERFENRKAETFVE